MIYRKQLLPLWIRFFSWMFLLFLVSPIILIVGIIMGYMELRLFGIRYYGAVLRPLPIFMILIMTFHGFAAYGLLWGKWWGVNVGIACAFIGTTLSVIGMISSFTQGKPQFQFSLILQMLFLIELFNVREKWVTLDEKKS